MSTQWKNCVRILSEEDKQSDEGKTLGQCCVVNQYKREVVDKGSRPEMAPALKRNQWGYKNMLWVLLSPPGVFGGVEAGHVFIFFDDIHLFTGPTKQMKSYND